MERISTTAADLMLRMLRQARPPKLRTYRQFAEEELVLPTGLYRGQRFRVSRAPHLGLLLDEIDSGRWRQFAITGPVQSGKTTAAFVLPNLYTLFELNEDAVAGVPDGNMVNDKWKNDLLPIIKASRFEKLLPLGGPGSRDGDIKAGDAIRFRNGASLKFLTGGGGDKSRAGVTVRTAVVTEVDGFDVVGAESLEGDKLTQITERTESFGEQARIFLECTVSIETKRTWQEYTRGTASRICIPCPHCGEYVSPERENLVGWQNAASEVEAAAKSAVACPHCACLWTEEQRVAAVHRCVLAHRGQTVGKDGVVVGPVPETYTLGFRWNAIHNLLKPISETGRKEWLAARESDPDTGNRTMCQKHWAIPPKATDEESSLRPAIVVARTVTLDKGQLPDGLVALTCGCDLGKHIGHYVLLGWTRSPEGTASSHVVDYGRFDVPTSDLGKEMALPTAVRKFRDGIWHEYREQVRAIEKQENRKIPQVLLYDGGWEQELVYPAASEGWPYTGCCKGFGERQMGGGKPKSRTLIKELSGDGYRAVKADDEKYPLFEQISDRFKGYVHDALLVPMDPETGKYRPGAMTLYRASNPGDHLTWTRHIMAEQPKLEFVAGSGWRRLWERKDKQNHFLDATALGVVGAALAKVLGTVASVPSAVPGVASSATAGAPTMQATGMERADGTIDALRRLGRGVTGGGGPGRGRI